MDIFLECDSINSLLVNGDDSIARDKIIKLLDFCETNNIKYPEILNHLIRQVGLYPYIKTENSSWQDRFVYESFKVDTGDEESITLHREQSFVLAKLLDGKSIALTAPTSFGKSFIIDSFISIKQPKNIVIIVPTIALTDETRRRLHRKFSHNYKIITTSDVKLEDKNIFIFPQERAIHYLDDIGELDMLIIDEFYKASPEFDKERSPSLLRAILELSQKSKQRYFLAPNISDLNGNIFTTGMEFIKIDFNTVYLEKHELYKQINKDQEKKTEYLLKILRNTRGKTLIYAGTYSGIESLSNIIISNFDKQESPILNNFAKWLGHNYDSNWMLVSLIQRRTGVHNGQLHRSLSQIQIKLFDIDDGLNNIISTSSIIEGVNTSAENVVVWRNKNGRTSLNDFTYKNIIGRGGRMFKHFVGKIFILEQPPAATNTQLNLEFPHELIGDIDITPYKESLSNEILKASNQYSEEMADILGPEAYHSITSHRHLVSNDASLIKKIALEIKNNPNEWMGLGYLNSTDINDWDNYLYKIINLKPGAWESEYSKFVSFIKIISCNWTKTIPRLLEELSVIDIGIDSFFKLEKTMAYKLASLLNDVNILQKHIIKNRNIDIAPFIAKISNAFLPPTVYLLEEYGLPRMVSKKIHKSGAINFQDKSSSLHDTINKFNSIGLDYICNNVKSLDDFDIYILEYFYEGITTRQSSLNR